MTVEAFYGAIGGDYSEVIGRLRSDERITKYLRRYPEDDSFDNLCKNLEQGNYGDAFVYSHNLKGVCANLGLKGLLSPSSELCEMLRGGEPKGDWQGLFEQVKTQHEKVIQNLKELA